MLKKLEIQIFYPILPRRGVLKDWKSLKLVVEPRLQNMIFRTHKKRNKSKRWPLDLKNSVSDGNFCTARWHEISFSPNFEILKPRSISEIGVRSGRIKLFLDKINCHGWGGMDGWCRLLNIQLSNYGLGFQRPTKLISQLKLKLSLAKLILGENIVW